MEMFRSYEYGFRRLYRIYIKNGGGHYNEKVENNC